VDKSFPLPNHLAANWRIMLTGVTPSHKGFTPSGKIAHLLFDSLNIICIFKLFQELTTSVRSCLCRARTAATRKFGSSGIRYAFFRSGSLSA